MRLDREHAYKIEAHIITDDAGRRVANFDIEFMLHAFGRLNLWERGILSDALLRAAEAKRLSIEQRALLALFLPTGGDDE
jgi:hypothetical protein